MSKQLRRSAWTRRQLGLGLLSGIGLVLAGCGGGDDGDDQPLYAAFNDLRAGMTKEDVQRRVNLAPLSGTSSSVLRWETDTEILEVTFSGNLISMARWTDRNTGQSFLRTFRFAGNGGGGTGTLYEAFLALRPGMTRADVIRRVPVDVSQGASSSQVLWVDGEEALGVRFNGSSDGSTITFAQWGLSIAAGSRNETRTF
jgi:uncharacterized lipoprotein YmbA